MQLQRLWDKQVWLVKCHQLDTALDFQREKKSEATSRVLFSIWILAKTKNRGVNCNSATGLWFWCYKIKWNQEEKGSTRTWNIRFYLCQMFSLCNYVCCHQSAGVQSASGRRTVDQDIRCSSAHPSKKLNNHPTKKKKKSKKQSAVLAQPQTLEVHHLPDAPNFKNWWPCRTMTVMGDGQEKKQHVYRKTDTTASNTHAHTHAHCDHV